VFDLADLADFVYEDIFTHTDPESGLTLVLVINDTTLGPALGGTRFRYYPNNQDALYDVMRLSQAMTCKAALANIPFGGGAAVIRAPEGRYDRTAMMEAYGRFLNSLEGAFTTYEDSGTRIEDMDFLQEISPFVAGVSDARGGSGDPATFTATGVLRAIEACVHHVYGADSLAGLKVLVQGVGHVGSRVARRLIRYGCRLTITDFHPEKCDELAYELGADVVPWDSCIDADVDVFAPCGIGPVLHPGTIGNLRAKIVCGACSNVLGRPEDALEVHRRGIVYAPDYVANAGALFNVATELTGYSRSKATILTNGIYNTVERILDISDETDTPTAEVADNMAREKLEAVRREREERD